MMMMMILTCSMQMRCFLKCECGREREREIKELQITTRRSTKTGRRPLCLFVNNESVPKLSPVWTRGEVVSMSY